MSDSKRLALATATAAVETGAGVQTNTTPFMIGHTVLYRVEPTAFTGTIKIETSEDNVSWTTQSTHAIAGTSDATITGTIELAQYVRYDTTAYTAGSADVALES